MPYYDFIWTGYNIEHVAQHGVQIEEAEDVVRDPSEVTVSRTSGRPVAYGFSATGRYLKVVYELVDESTVYIITAFEK